MKTKIVAFLPCRKGSQRVINKNTRTFAGINGGLTSIKINQLIKSKLIDKIIVSTDDKLVKEISEDLLQDSNKEYEILDRPAFLATSEATTDSVIEYVGEIIKEHCYVMWTHVTSPFIDEETYDRAIKEFFERKQFGFDSMMSVTELKKFIWNSNGPINYKPEEIKWPQTQNISPLFEVNSGFFLSEVSTYKELRNRIGTKPLLYPLDTVTSLDIDWEEDFNISQAIWNQKQKGEF
ncbi:acylneuraminate cytidylyltransferase family protein [Rossellomorea oryzaecorticis]|uniref:Acylneuraminate cytidylyltransferase family protein n=1 Tax=Rossellomorea oryzaecorticis TaxID=1396505 RepID=A0ABU9K453_9BACI